MAAQAEAADAAPYVIFETSLGAFSVELYSQHAPQSCKNFRELARTGESFHCCGDLSRDGTSRTADVEHDAFAALR